MNNQMTKLVEIILPFTPIKLNGNEICAITARPGMGKTTYALNLIKENSFILDNKKCLAYFVGNNKRKVESHPDYKSLVTRDHINLQWTSFGREDGFIFDVKRDVRKFNPEYIVIDGFEKLFKRYESDLKLMPEVDILLSDLRLLSDERKMPIIITTHVLSTAELRMSPPRPALCDLGSNTLETTADIILGLNSLYYYGYELDSNLEDISNTMELYQLKPWRFELEPYQFLTDKKTGMFSPKEQKE